MRAHTLWSMTGVAGSREPGSAARVGAPVRSGGLYGGRSLLGLPSTIAPMIPVECDEAFDSRAHLFEIAWEGVRALIFIDRESVRVQDAYGRDATERYPELTAACHALKRPGVVLDGSIVCLDEEGVPDFSLLRPRLVESAADATLRSATAPVVFQAFDILYRDGASVMDEPLRSRKELLRRTVFTNRSVAVPDCVEGEGVAFFEAAREHGLPGIIAKEAAGRYLPGVGSRSWLRIPVYRRAYFVVGGFTYGGSLRTTGGHAPTSPFHSLLLGHYDVAGVLRFAGELAGGFPSSAVEGLASLLDATAATEPPFADPPTPGRLVFWCRPEIVVSARFAGWAPEGTLRFPVFEWLRPDVPPEACRIPETSR